MITKDDKRWSFAGHTLMIILSICALAPFALLIIASFTDEAAAIRDGYTFFPAAWSLSAYTYIAQKWEMLGRAYAVTIFVTVVGTVVGVMLSAMLGYTISRRDLPGRRFLLFFLTFAMLFRGGLTATYVIYTQFFHIKNTIFALLLPNLLLNVHSVMMFRNYFENTLPQALLEAAYIDGATEMQTFRNIALPLSLPMVATQAMIQALVYWNNWQNGLYYLSTDSPLQNIQTLLNRINEDIKFIAQNNLGGELSLSDLPTTTIRMAIAVVGIVPILLLYPILQKMFVRGISSGAVKE